MEDIIKITILKEDILNSNYFHCGDCAVARAVKRKFPNIRKDPKYFGVGGDQVDVEGHKYFIEEHKLIADMYELQDSKNYVEPRDFECTLTKM
jgi:hypothetical protein